MKNHLNGWLVVGVLTVASTCSAQPPATQDAAANDATSPAVTKDQPMSVWMEKKLEYSKDILEALTAGRYEDVEKHAEQLRVIGKIEGFVRGRSASYTHQLQSFDQSTRELKRQAKAKDLDAATLAFHQLTTSCIRCHQTLRNPEASDESTRKPESDQ